MVQSIALRKHLGTANPHEEELDLGRTETTALLVPSKSSRSHLRVCWVSGRERQEPGSAVNPKEHGPFLGLSAITLMKETVAVSPVR